jgi:hypothetical protein
MAIIDEPFSVGRMFRSFIGRVAAKGHSEPTITETPDDSTSEPPLRDQLLEARANVQHQIELLEYSTNHSRGGPSQNPMLIAELQKTLAEIEAALNDVGPGEA